MGLTNWKNSPDGLIYKYDVVISKNYLNEEDQSLTIPKELIEKLPTEEINRYLNIDETNKQ